MPLMRLLTLTALSEGLLKEIMRPGMVFIISSSHAHCPVTLRLLEQWCNIFEPPLDLNSESFEQLYWYGVAPDGQFETFLLSLILDCFKYVLWKFKTKKRISNFPMFIQENYSIINNMANMSKKVKLGISGNNFMTNFLQALG